MNLRASTVLTCVLGFLGATTTASAQCILSNPSFEIADSGGNAFGGWIPFGNVGSTNIASHGSVAARVSGPDNGSWEVSGYWQGLDCVVGEQWRATGWVRVPSVNPLVGGNAALVNIEWRDSADGLISYDSFTVADNLSPIDQYLEFSVLSNPAPVGTVKARILLGGLQSPVDPVSDVDFDQVTFFSTSSPTMDELQWTDFPGGRTLDFAGYTWRVKGTGYYGPGPNVFSDAADAVWTDDGGDLHLTLAQRRGTWQSTEVVLEEALGYGDYILTTTGRLDTLDIQAVLGIFLWQYGPCWDPSYLWWNPFNEIDIEYGRWGNPAQGIGQFVAQPYDWPGNLTRFDTVFSAGEVVSHAMRWLADRIEYRVWRGGPADETAGNTVVSWTYTGPHISRPEQPRMHLNLWRLDPAVPSTNQEAVFSDFAFIPEGAASAAPGEDSLPAVPQGHLSDAAPNPFNPRTLLRFTLDREGPVSLKIYTLEGWLVRTLVDAQLAQGDHEFLWDGRDQRTRALPSGVYVYQLQGRDFVESKKAALLK